MADNVFIVRLARARASGAYETSIEAACGMFGCSLKWGGMAGVGVRIHGDPVSAENILEVNPVKG